jgi:hypothetical protein
MREGSLEQQAREEATRKREMWEMETTDSRTAGELQSQILAKEQLERRSVGSPSPEGFNANWAILNHSERPRNQRLRLIQNQGWEVSIPTKERVPRSVRASTVGVNAVPVPVPAAHLHFKGKEQDVRL